MEETKAIRAEDLEQLERISAQLESAKPALQITAIIEAAEFITGKKGLTLAEAVAVILKRGPAPIIEKELENITKETAAKPTKGLSQKQWEAFLWNVNPNGGYLRLETVAKLSTLEAVRGEEAPIDAIKTLNEAGGSTQFARRLAKAIVELSASNKEDAPQQPKNPNTGEVITEAARSALEKVKEFTESPEYQQIKSAIETARKYIEENRESLLHGLDMLSDAAKSLQDLLPFVQMELDSGSDPQYSGLTWGDIYDQIEMNGTPATDLAAQVLEQARKRKADHEAAEAAIAEAEALIEELPRIISNPMEALNYPLDKPNSKIWTTLEEADATGQLQIAVDTSSAADKKKGLAAPILIGLDFNDLGQDIKITKQLNAFDKFVYTTAAGLYNAGNTTISIQQIHRGMGNSTNPNQDQREKIDESLSKMGAARVYVDNTSEVEVNKSYPTFKYDGPLLPFERVRVYINNTLTESAIHLFREPPMITFARQRGQITPITQELLNSPISKTEANLRLMDYLLERIGHMKNPKSKAPKKMLLATVYKMAGITTRSQKSRAPKKIKTYLDHFQKSGFIKGYRMDNTSITIDP